MNRLIECPRRRPARLLCVLVRMRSADDRLNTECCWYASVERDSKGLVTVCGDGVTVHATCMLEAAKEFSNQKMLALGLLPSAFVGWSIDLRHHVDSVELDVVLA